MMTTNSSDPSQARAIDFVGLLQSARDGNRESLGQLLHWYTDYLRSLAATQLDRRLRRRLNPSDIVQEAMLAAHRDFNQFRGDTQIELRCWLRAILIHVLHRSFDKHVKVEKRDVRREISIDDSPMGVDRSAADLASLLASPIDSPSTPMRRLESRHELESQLTGLREDYRQVILLRVIEGMPFEQIAQRMNRSSGAVRMLWLRALEAFKSEAEGDADGGGQSDS
ncbi:sigma-70 family RNA polymerase sigma factor [Stieleria sp. JC731]|uniref:sigma-70 family RNA polymerase sigma factor n=1 Tax=Pirellulaceae TaxID=2691357 RepID=UPI001E317124|nr:sigma-70 family RNA polymerase sigma factor [Stieleria sp. JC731]MCC9599527.1 sigma-70 family RNA polymerase sigma factor [Stieleria sp. JC731]